MDAKQFVESLWEVLASTDDEGNDINQQTIRRIDSFEDVGMLTKDPGLVVRMNDGSEFQVTVVQSQPARR